jgi:hypothetical protein
LDDDRLQFVRLGKPLYPEISTNIKPFDGDIPKKLKVSPGNADSEVTSEAMVEAKFNGISAA